MVWNKFELCNFLNIIESFGSRHIYITYEPIHNLRNYCMYHYIMFSVVDIRIVFKNLSSQFHNSINPSEIHFFFFFFVIFRTGISQGQAKRGDFSYNLISPRGWWACRWRPKRARVVGGVTAITPFTRWKNGAAGGWRRR